VAYAPLPPPAGAFVPSPFSPPEVEMETDPAPAFNPPWPTPALEGRPLAQDLCDEASAAWKLLNLPGNAVQRDIHTGTVIGVHMGWLCALQTAVTTRTLATGTATRTFDEALCIRCEAPELCVRHDIDADLDSVEWFKEPTERVVWGTAAEVGALRRKYGHWLASTSRHVSGLPKSVFDAAGDAKFEPVPQRVFFPAIAAKMELSEESVRVATLELSETVKDLNTRLRTVALTRPAETEAAWGRLGAEAAGQPAQPDPMIQWRATIKAVAEQCETFEHFATVITDLLPEFAGIFASSGKEGTLGKITLKDERGRDHLMWSPDINDVVFRLQARYNCSAKSAGMIVSIVLAKVRGMKVVVEDLRGKNADGSASRHWASIALFKGATMGDIYLATQLVVRDGCRPHVCLTFDATHVVEADAHMFQVQMMFEDGPRNEDTPDPVQPGIDAEQDNASPGDAAGSGGDESWASRGKHRRIMRYPLVSARWAHVITRLSSNLTCRLFCCHRFLNKWAERPGREGRAAPRGRRWR